MLSWWIKRSVAAFERRWGYDAAYMRDIVDDAGPQALLPLSGLQRIGGYRRDVPAGPYYVAKIVASNAASCGPCLQLTVSMATAAGVDAATIRAALRDEREALPADTRAAYDLATSVVARDGGGEQARAEIVRRYGARGLLSIAYGMIAANAYPTLKYALGYGHACARVRVGEEEIVPAMASTA